MVFIQQCTGPAAKHVDWQLGNWIRSSQQNSHAEGHCDTRAAKSPGPPPSQSVTGVAEPSWEVKPQQEFTEKAGKSRHYKQPLSPTPPSPTGGLTSCSHKHSCTLNSSSVKAGSAQTPASVKCEKVDNRDPCFTVRPKVKTKMVPNRKNKGGCETKKGSKRTSKHESHDKRKTGSESEVALVLYGHCPSCGGQYPKSCLCPTHSPAQPDQLPPAPPIRISCTNSKSDTFCQKDTQVLPKITHKRLNKTPRRSRDSHRYPTSLLVKIELSLLSKVPQVPGNHRESLCKKTPSVVKPHHRRNSEASAAQKFSKKSHNVRNDNQLFQSGLLHGVGLISA